MCSSRPLKTRPVVRTSNWNLYWVCSSVGEVVGGLITSPPGEDASGSGCRRPRRTAMPEVQQTGDRFSTGRKFVPRSRLTSLKWRTGCATLDVRFQHRAG